MKKNAIFNLAFGVIGLILVLLAQMLNSEAWTGVIYSAVFGIFGGSAEYLMFGSTWKNFIFRIISAIVGALIGIGICFLI